jgi:putative aldouronate transport system substrate-binding protein
MNYSASGFYIQKDVLADAGYPDLSNLTLEKYFGMLEAYATKYPEINGTKTTAFIAVAPRGTEWRLTNPPNLLAGYPNNGDVIVDENNKAHIYADSDYAYRYYKFLNEMNAKGLIARDGFTLTNDQYLERLATGAVLGMHDQYWTLSGGLIPYLTNNNMYERTFVTVMPTFDGAAPWYADREVMNTQQGFGVSVSCKQVDVVLTFLEVLLSEEWQKLLFWGVEGEDYLVRDDGLFYRTEAMREEQNDQIWWAKNQLRAFRDNMPKRQGTWPDGNTFDAGGSNIEFYESLSDYDKDFLSAYGKLTWREFLNNPPDNPIYYPCWNLPLSNEATTVQAELRDTSVEYLPQLILAAPADYDNLWNQYVNQLHLSNISAFEESINEGIQMRIEAAGG